MPYGPHNWLIRASLVQLKTKGDCSLCLNILDKNVHFKYWMETTKQQIEIHVAKATNGQKNGSAEDSKLMVSFGRYVVAKVLDNSEWLEL